MGQFLRDQRVNSVALDENTLSRLNDFFQARVAVHHAAVPDGPSRVVLFYVIRFDEKGYRFIDFNDVRKYFREARNVERVIYMVDSAANRSSAGLIGTSCELRLDAKDPNNCWLTVTADGKDWVDITFAGLSEILADHKTWSGFVRTQWTGLLVQLLGVGLGFALSLWAALKIAPSLNIDNAFVVCFFFAMLVYSNIWGYVNGQIAKAIDFAFPNVRFKRPGRDKLYMAVQTLIGSLIVAFAGFVLNKLFGLIGSVLASLMR